MFFQCDNLKYIKLYNFTGDNNIFPDTLNTDQLTICINSESDATFPFLPNAERNCVITNLELRINYCLKIKNVKYGLYINDTIIKLEKDDECTWIHHINMNEDNLIFTNILYKNNKVLRMNSKSKYLNIANIKESVTYEGCTLSNHKYTTQGILFCNFSNIIA